MKPEKKTYEWREALRLDHRFEVGVRVRYPHPTEALPAKGQGIVQRNGVVMERRPRSFLMKDQKTGYVQEITSVGKGWEVEVEVK